MRPVLIAGAVIVLVFFGGLGSWAAIAPLQSVAVAPGVLNVESQRKTIQHLEGGIVAEILVAEGDGVVAGQALIRLDPVQARSLMTQLRIRHQTLKAQEARLLAERDGRATMDFEYDREDAEISNAVAGEIRIFEARRAAMDSEKAILNNRIAQLREEMTGLQGQIGAQTQQLSLIDEELTAQEKMFERQLVSMQRMIELKRERSEIVGDRNQQRAAIARIKQSIDEEKLKILDLKTTLSNEVVAQLREVETSLADVAERSRAAADVVERTTILAPLDGKIVNLQIHTVGGVVAPGDDLMDIVPAREALVVDARVNPSDIDAVNPGLKAQVVLTAFSRRTVKPLDGIVTSVSADRLTDARTDEPYYLARVSLVDDAVHADEDLELSAGMQADVMIITGEQTAIEYLFAPVERSFYRAMREQ